MKRLLMMSSTARALTSGLGAAWEYGDAIVGGFEERVEVSDVTSAIAVLEPFISEHRRSEFDRVLDERSTSFRVAYEHPSNPNNVWACLRTIDAFGVQMVDFVNDDRRRAMELGRDRSASYTVRRSQMKSAMGAQKWLTLNTHESTRDMVASLKRDYTVVATDLREGAVPIDEFHTDQKIALVFGNEEFGISDEMRSLADHRVYVPMRGFAESLNLSVSTAACLAQLSRYITPDLSTHQKNQLKLDWLVKSVKAAKPLLARHQLL